MAIKKLSPTLFLALGIYLPLPLITTNCAILALAIFQTNRGYGLLQGLAFALGSASPEDVWQQVGPREDGGGDVRRGDLIESRLCALMSHPVFQPRDEPQVGAHVGHT
jgi:hypothetical protein